MNYNKKINLLIISLFSVILFCLIISLDYFTVNTNEMQIIDYNITLIGAESKMESSDFYLK